MVTFLDTNYGEPCNNDIQCLEDHSNLKCINKECKCPNGTQFTLDTLTCQNSMGGINKPCLVNKKCSIENSYCNPYGICKCKVNYYYTLNDKCELDKSRSNCSKDDVFLHTQSRTLYRPAKKPNDPCLSNIDCNDVKHTTCQSNACKCIRNFYVSEKTGNCTRYAKQPNDRCIEDKGCRKVDNSKCKSRICQCDENFPLNLATKKCEILLGRKCTEDSNCDTTKNVVCSKGKCVCDVNHFEKNYTCVLGIDGYCKESEECYVNNSLCQNDRCQCAVNFYASKNKSLCIANAKALYDYCESDESCQEMENTECSNNKCQCKLKFVEKDGKCRSLYYCEVKSDCQQPKYSVCRNNRCVCSLNRYLSSNNTKCSSYAKSIGSSCEDDKRCARVKNTKCIEKKCACIENYFEDNNKCKGIIDAECSENSDCIADNSLCESNRCKCSENFHPSSDKRECRKYADHVNDLCEDNDDCTKVKNSKCSENDQCVCKMKYFEKDNECKAFIGTNCTENSECGANNSQCYSNECVCSHGFYSSINKQECIKYAAKPNEPCESNKSCTHVEYSYCSKSNECTCKPNYLLIDDKCRGLIGENCSVDSGCGVKYSTCKSNTCTCPIDYYPSNDKTNCFQYAKKLNDFCETDGACRDVKFTYCSENRQCTCLMNYTVTNDSCRGLIGTNCSEDLDCATDNSKCELNVCQCLQGFQFSFSKQRCYSYSKHLNDFCETNDDCNNLKYTYCTVNNKCSCLANYIAVDGRCAGLVGEKCSDDNDCAVDNSKCDDTTCQCKVDFYLSTNKDKCYSFASQVNDFCETDIGCQKLDRTRCWENACTCWPNYTIVDGNCRGLINAKCFVNSDCSIESSICASNTCQCPINFYLSADEKQCHSFAKRK
ncbi:prion-like-(Q/N-rich) domain-bearing protein 25 [Microplitis mediator]|uniref:prion-like-(Q/N-rich) domain-bearing protein 25 n=1 Tax=Microplitis mediator TaxID=375433 RepID=UPI002553B477|nr:prion-like-(Q/N-rich) domain-bearing protein 25 [Microplitis mediator]